MSSDSQRSQKVALKWDHSNILATGQSYLHCKIKKTLLIRNLKPTLNENVGCEKLLLLLLAIYTFFNINSVSPTYIAHFRAQDFSHILYVLLVDVLLFIPCSGSILCTTHQQI